MLPEESKVPSRDVAKILARGQQTRSRPPARLPLELRESHWLSCLLPCGPGPRASPEQILNEYVRDQGRAPCKSEAHCPLGWEALGGDKTRQQPLSLPQLQRPKIRCYVLLAGVTVLVIVLIVATSTRK